MKKIFITTVYVFAGISLLIACNLTSSHKNNSPAAALQQVPPNAGNSFLVGSYRGVSATCEDGSPAHRTDYSVRATTLNFHADGHFSSSTKMPHKRELDTRGTYTIDGQVLTLSILSQSYPGQTGIVQQESRATYTLNGNQLILSVDPVEAEEDSCPPQQAVILEYSRQQSRDLVQR